MSWLVHHTQSEGYASQADEMFRRHEGDRAAELYRLAAEAEVHALENLASSKTRTIGITAVSAVSLYFKAQEFLQAKKIAHRWLATDLLPPFAVEELEDLLQFLHYEESRVKSGVQFIEDEMLVSIRGGEVLYGAAPLKLGLEKVKQIRNILYRTTEMLLDLPLRAGGHSPPQEVRQYCDPWLFQAHPGSYQFSIRVRKPQAQAPVSSAQDSKLHAEQITLKSLEIIRATVQEPEGALIKIVPEAVNRKIFLKLTYKLAPSLKSKALDQVEIKLSDDVEPRPVILLPKTRLVINEALKKLSKC